MGQRDSQVEHRNNGTAKSSTEIMGQRDSQVEQRNNGTGKSSTEIMGQPSRAQK